MSKISSHLPKLTERTKQLAVELLQGQLRALSRAITLCESSRQDQRSQAAALLQHVTEESTSVIQRKMFRIGVTGPPGAGKSSVIEKLGLRATKNEQRVAVLAIDPSSNRSGGSILGDKTRMEELSRDPSAFVRPSPSSGHIGGLTRSTADAAILCEAAGCSLLFVETVGGGQSDVDVADMVDMLLLVIPPAGGDELQGIKKGIVEVADLVAVNKADGNLEEAAKVSVSEYRAALHYSKPITTSWTPKVLACSSRTGFGLDDLWDSVEDFKSSMSNSGELFQRRKSQAERLLWSNVQNEIVERLKKDPDLNQSLNLLEKKVAHGELASRTAAFSLVETFLQLQNK